MKRRGPEVRNLYRDILRAKQRRAGPVLLSPEEFTAYQVHFTGSEWIEFAIRLRRGQRNSLEKAVSVPDLDLRRLEQLRMVAWTAEPVQARRARKAVMVMIVAALPARLKQRRHRLLDDPLPIVRYIAERRFLWAVLRGERNACHSLPELKTHYAYLQDVPWARLQQRLLDSPQNNAYEDAAAKFGGTPEALRISVMQPRRR